jgi:glutaconyl-CoA/methylmalonyl-CoA decarboxylase subunit delta
MGNSINLSETLIIALGALTAIFAILVLYAISMVSKLSQVITEGKLGNTAEQNVVQSFNNSNNAASHNPVQNFNDSDDEEDRLVVALAASIAAANDKPDSYFHISKITRIR